PYLDGPCEVMATPLPGERWAQARDFVKTRAPRLAGWGRSIKRTVYRLRGGSPASVPRSDPALDEGDFDAVHVRFQGGFPTELPSIYHPHDLQHLHLPEFFTPEQRRDREIVYRALCEDASMVAVASNWVREDVLASYQIPEDRVVVVPLAPPVDAYARPSPE